LTKGTEGISTTNVESSDQDEVFHWGREVDVEWRKLAWVTFRDQVSDLVPYRKTFEAVPGDRNY
jgi:hypothetical protein